MSRNHQGGGRTVTDCEQSSRFMTGSMNTTSITMVKVFLLRSIVASSVVTVSTTQAKASANAREIHKARPNTDSCPSHPRNTQGPGTRSLTTLPTRLQRPLAGWLYIYVAVKTVVLPTKNYGVNLKSNSATDARNDKMIARLVAKPLRMLCEYLMTTAVIKPPKV